MCHFFVDLKAYLTNLSLTMYLWTMKIGLDEDFISDKVSLKIFESILSSGIGFRKITVISGSTQIQFLIFMRNKISRGKAGEYLGNRVTPSTKIQIFGGLGN